MKKHYELGDVKALLEKTSSGYYKVTIKYDTNTYEYLFSNLEKALLEIMSYAEIEEEDYEIAGD